MSKCIVPGCQNETDKGRLLCTRHYHIGIIESADGMCIECRQVRVMPGHAKCKKCLNKKVTDDKV